MEDFALQVNDEHCLEDIYAWARQCMAEKWGLCEGGTRDTRHFIESEPEIPLEALTYSIP